MHASGERLGQLTGIAAILRFPMPDLDLLDEHHHNDHEMNSDQQEETVEIDDISSNNHIDHTDEDQTRNNSRTIK